MKNILLVLVLLFSNQVFANDYAKKLIVNELSEYASDYGLISFEVLDYLGVQNKMYTFNITYKKSFCDSMDSECLVLRCDGTVGLDSDAIVDFETQMDSSKCYQAH
jgi:hypothetical protein